MTWDLHRPEVSWRVWQILEGMGWKFLPCEGGLLDQPDWLIEDLATISNRKAVLEELVKDAPSSVPKRDVT